MIKKILAAALLSALLPVSASAATTFITAYQTYGNCGSIINSHFWDCVKDNKSMADTYARNRVERLKKQYKTQDVTKTSVTCAAAGRCTIKFRVRH